MNYDTTTTEGKIAVMQAHAKGEAVQSIACGNAKIYGWKDDMDPVWDWSLRDYRIKPKEPRRWWLRLKEDGSVLGISTAKQIDYIEVVEVLK